MDRKPRSQVSVLSNVFLTCLSQPASTGALVTLDLPAALSQRVMNALKADARTVDLRAQAPHFYTLAARILELFEEEEMVDILTEVRYSSKW